PPFPPGFTPEVHQQGHYDNGNPNVDNRSCGFKLKEGGSILDILDEMIKEFESVLGVDVSVDGGCKNVAV
nr:hypothetical protein [Tanacetum cinerariifolium]